MLCISKSSPRKLTDSSFGWRRLDGYYNELDPTSLIDSTILFCIAFDLCSYFYPEFNLKEIKLYLKRRRFPQEIDESLIDRKKSCFSGIEGIVRIRSLTPKYWNEGKYYDVSVTNLVEMHSSLEDKVKSFLSLDVNCGCTRSKYQNITRAPSFQRRIYRDKRDFSALPGAFVRPIDKHSCLALIYSHFFYERESFDTFNLPDHIIKASKKFIEKQLEKKEKIPNYLSNKKIRYEVCKSLIKFKRLGESLGFITPLP